jgi:hypothetical protein
VRTDHQFLLVIKDEKMNTLAWMKKSMIVSIMLLGLVMTLLASRAFADSTPTPVPTEALSPTASPTPGNVLSPSPIPTESLSPTPIPTYVVSPTVLPTPTPNISIPIIIGGRSASIGAVTKDINSITLSGEDKIVHLNVPITINNPDKNPWDLILSAVRFTNTNNQDLKLPPDALSVESCTFLPSLAGMVNCPKSIVTPDGINLFSSTISDNPGVYIVQVILKLTIDKNTEAGNYSSTITATITS